MTFATARSIPQAHGRMVDGAWAKGEFLGTELNGKTLGIVGLGRVGQEAAKRLGSLGMELVAYDPYISEERADQIGAELVELDACIDRADFLTVHVPLTDETEGLIGEAELARMEGGYVINVARGGVVDEPALAEAVEDGVVAGAALDVFADEPLPEGSRLREVEDIVLTPHLGASTAEAQEHVAVATAEQVLAAFAGEPVMNALNAPSVDESAFPRIEPYIGLAATAGQVAAGLFDGRVEEIEVAYAGEIAEEDVELITASALQGAFEPLEWQVNAVNAPRVAEERGVDVTETKTRSSEDFRSLLTVTVGDGTDELAVSGTLFTGRSRGWSRSTATAWTRSPRQHARRAQRGRARRHRPHRHRPRRPRRQHRGDVQRPGDHRRRGADGVQSRRRRAGVGAVGADGRRPDHRGAGAGTLGLRRQSSVSAAASTPAMSNRAPPSADSCTPTVQPCVSAISLTMLRPSPVPGREWSTLPRKRRRARPGEFPSRRRRRRSRRVTARA
ncbi:glyoxylate reductase [Halolamina pelagica]|uniref:Glyoxylate reductase n=1 Tax=Halolamina pelagica TaxID=699431 RepID=A0A0P7GQ21_9EURY|nr:glyoxylate reductase [Halolamina pelagica]